MATDAELEAVVIDAIRRKLDMPELTKEQALQHTVARSLFDGFLFGRAEPAASDGLAAKSKNTDRSPRTLVGTRVGLRAALEDTFDVGQIQATETERELLVEESDLVTIGGQRRLRLRNDLRAAVLSDAIGSESYDRLLANEVTDDVRNFEAISADPVRLPSAWMRSFLAGQFGGLDGAPLTELRAALDARERIAGVEPLPTNLPSVTDLRRRVDLAALLEPLRILTGERGGWQGNPRRDRFIGRGAELRQLRAFVDEQRSTSIGEAFQRLRGRAQRAVTRSAAPSVFMVYGRGGLGKSTLLAKFVLDHALDQLRPFPFAYLDFDRAGIDASQPLQLLIEVARQVGAQFPSAHAELSVLAQDIRSDLLAGPTAQAKTSDPFSRFARILREHATQKTRAFLLVLDTLESVQWNAAAVRRLAEFVDELRARGLAELRVVASGRADIPELRVWEGSDLAYESSALAPLAVDEATELATSLGRSIIASEWSPRWSRTIAGEPLDDPARREPLSVRVAVDTIARESPSGRVEILREIAGPDAMAGGDFVARIYELRILNHVRDPNAKALAWPGLAIRRVTREIVRNLLAPLCGIEQSAADSAFEALEREVWLVTREGDALRHNQELRSRTLPLMRRKSGERFNEVAHAAVDYFAQRKDASDDDHLEWLYHRLLADESPSLVARDVRPGELSLLARAKGDFAEGTAAASFLAAQSAPTRLPPPRVRALSPTDALYHLSATASEVFTFEDSTIDQVALELSDRLPRQDLGRDLMPWARALWIKTGRWSAMPSSPQYVFDAPAVTARALTYWAARAAPAFNDELRAVFIERAVAMVLRDTDRNGVRMAVQAMTLARMYGSEEQFFRVDRLVADILQRLKPNPTPSTQAALRLAIVLGRSSRGPALGAWLASRRRRVRQKGREETTFALSEIRALARIYPAATELIALAEGDDRPARFAAPHVVDAAHRALSEVLDQLTSGDTDQAVSKAVSRMFAIRDEDWIIPIAYALTRALPGGHLEVARRVRVYTSRESGVKPQTRSLQPSDLLDATRTADEAGDLPEFLAARRADCAPDAPATAELQRLMDYRELWSLRIRDLIADNEPLEVETRPRVSERPPEPRPILDEDDPQRGRWGGSAERDGRIARAVLESVERDLFYFSIVVESTDESPLEAPVIFHLHSSYPRSVITIRRIAAGQAVLQDWNAFGVFAIGVQVKTRTGVWTGLEVDLASLDGLPRRFLNR